MKLLFLLALSLHAAGPRRAPVESPWKALQRAAPIPAGVPGRGDPIERWKSDLAAVLDAEPSKPLAEAVAESYARSHELDAGRAAQALEVFSSIDLTPAAELAERLRAHEKALAAQFPGDKLWEEMEATTLSELGVSAGSSRAGEWRLETAAMLRARPELSVTGAMGMSLGKVHALSTGQKVDAMDILSGRLPLVSDRPRSFALDRSRRTAWVEAVRRSRSPKDFFAAFFKWLRPGRPETRAVRQLFRAGGEVYLLTGNAGSLNQVLYRREAGGWRLLSGALRKHVYDLGADEGRVLAATGEGLFALNERTKRWEKLLDGRVDTARLFEGRLYAGTADGLLVREGREWKRAGLTGSEVRRLAERDGVLYASTNNGFFSRRKEGDKVKWTGGLFDQAVFVSHFHQDRWYHSTIKGKFSSLAESPFEMRKLLNVPQEFETASLNGWQTTLAGLITSSPRSGGMLLQPDGTWTALFGGSERANSILELDALRWLVASEEGLLTIMAPGAALERAVLASIEALLDSKPSPAPAPAPGSEFKDSEGRDLLAL